MGAFFSFGCGVVLGAFAIMSFTLPPAAVCRIAFNAPDDMTIQWQDRKCVRVTVTKVVLEP